MAHYCCTWNPLYFFLFCFMIFTACHSSEKKISYASTEEILSESAVQRMLVYESGKEEVEIIPDNLISITEYDSNGMKVSFLTINPYQKDTAKWDYFYEDGKMVKEITRLELYPSETNYEYDDKGLLTHSKTEGGSFHDIHYHYNNDGKLICEVGCSGAIGMEGDPPVWERTDSTIYHYKDGLLESSQFYYRDELFSDVHYVNYNERGQCTQEVDYGRGKNPEFSIEHVYNEKGLLIKNISEDLMDKKKTYQTIIYEYYK